VQQRRPARPAAPRRVVPAVWLSAQLLARPHSEASLVRRDAPMAASLHRVPERRPAAGSAPAWWQVPAAAWRQPVDAPAQVTASSSAMKAAVVARSVRPAASAPRVRLPAEEAVGVLDARVQPPGAASVLWGQPRAAEAEAHGAGMARPLGAALDAVTEPRRAAALPDVQVQRPGVAEQPARALAVPQPAAERPSAPPSWHLEGHLLPWLAPRQSVRSARATRRSRTASLSKQSWRAAGCEGLS
jgi:hypothetical protein